MLVNICVWVGSWLVFGGNEGCAVLSNELRLKQTVKLHPNDGTDMGALV